MDNIILGNNLAALEKRFPQLYKACKERLDNENSHSHVFCDISQQNEKILGVTKEGHSWYLNSRYNSEKAVDIWWEEAVGDGFHYKSVVFLCGISNAQILNRIASSTGKENVIVVYEPDVEIFMCVIKNIDITNLISDKRIHIYVNELNRHMLREYIHNNLYYELVKYTVIMTAQSYTYIYASETMEFMKLCENEIRRVHVEKNTLEDLGEEICDNIIKNMWLIAKSTSINQVKKYFEENDIDITKVPAIIVSAGPSLDKNVDELKNAKGKALIIAVDSAIRKLLAHNIVPDMIITVDAHKPMVLFDSEAAKQIPLVFSGQSRHDVITAHRGKTFAFASDTYHYITLNSIGKLMDSLKTGGSVANDAFSFVEYVGFKRIIFVGQDLAFTDDKKHASDVYEEKAIGEDDDDQYTYVEDIHGNQVLTFGNFRVYKEWFESRIDDNKELSVVNATEGGANIKGAVNMSLKDAIEKYCVKEFNADIFENIPYLFTDEELEQYYEFLKNILDRCDKLSDKFNQGIEAYNQLKELLMSKNIDADRLAKVNKVIEEVNNIDRKEPVMTLVSLYSGKEEISILEDIYEEQDDLAAAITVTEKGVRILEVYKKAINKIYDNVDALLKYEVSQDIYEVTEYNITFVN